MINLFDILDIVNYVFFTEFYYLLNVVNKILSTYFTIMKNNFESVIVNVKTLICENKINMNVCMFRRNERNKIVQ